MEQQYQWKTRYIGQEQRFQYHPATITPEVRRYGGKEVRGKMMIMKDKNNILI
jgi:hypothetical protein